MLIADLSLTWEENLRAGAKCKEGEDACVEGIEMYMVILAKNKEIKILGKQWRVSQVEEMIYVNIVISTSTGSNFITVEYRKCQHLLLVNDSTSGTTRVSIALRKRKVFMDTRSC